MRTILIAASLLGSSLFRFCDKSDDQPNPTAQQSAEIHAATQANIAADVNKAVSANGNVMTPRLGGNVVAVGAQRVEIALHDSGLIEAQISLTSGAPLPEPAQAKLAVILGGQGDAKVKSGERVELSWAPALQRFTGNARAKAEIAAPLDVELKVAEKVETATLASAVVLRAPEYGGAVMAAGEYSVELAARPAGEVEAHIKSATGTALDGSANLDVKARLQAEGSATPEIALRWDAPRAAFIGRADASARLKPGPVSVYVSSGGAVAVGGLAQLTLAGAATHGGRVLVTGNYSVELVESGGAVLAYVMDATGKAHAAGDLDLKLGLGADAGSLLKLAWDAPSACYKAKLNGKANFALQPLRLELKADGRTHIGALGRIDAKAKLGVSPNVALKADAKANALADAKANAGADAKAKLAASAPKIDAKADLNKAASARADLKASLPKVSVSAPKVKAEAKKTGSASGSAQAGFSFGTK